MTMQNEEQKYLDLLKAEGESPVILGTIETHSEAESIVELV